VASSSPRAAPAGLLGVIHVGLHTEAYTTVIKAPLLHDLSNDKHLACYRRKSECVCVEQNDSGCFGDGGEECEGGEELKVILNANDANNTN